MDPSIIRVLHTKNTHTVFCTVNHRTKVQAHLRNQMRTCRHLSRHNPSIISHRWAQIEGSNRGSPPFSCNMWKVTRNLEWPRHFKQQRKPSPHSEKLRVSGATFGLPASKHDARSTTSHAMRVALKKPVVEPPPLCSTAKLDVSVGKYNLRYRINGSWRIVCAADCERCRTVTTSVAGLCSSLLRTSNVVATKTSTYAWCELHVRVAEVSLPTQCAFQRQARHVLGQQLCLRLGTSFCTEEAQDMTR